VTAQTAVKGIAVDYCGNVYITRNDVNMVQKWVKDSGLLSTLAGGSGNSELSKANYAATSIRLRMGTKGGD